MTELAGQQELPADFPATVITADILINKSITEGLSQLEYFTDCLGPDPEGADAAARERRLLKGNMHLFAYLLDSVIADMLQQIQGVNRTWADKAAAELDDRLECGDYYPEMLWQWANERGLNPDSIIEAAKARIEQKDTK